MTLSSGEVQEHTGHADEVTAARKEIQTKAREINAQETGVRELEKERLARELRDELAQKTTAAQEVQQLGVNERRVEATEVAQSVARVLEGVKQGIIEPTDPKAAKFFGAVLERGITGTSAAHLQGFIDRYLTDSITFSSNEGQPTQFEKDLEHLKRTQGAVYSVVTDILTSSPQEYGLTPEHVEKLVEPLPIPDAKFAQTRDGLTKEDLDEHERIAELISNALVAEMQNPTRGLTAEDVNNINAFLAGIDITKQESVDAIQKLGIDPSDLKRFLELHPHVVMYIQSEQRPTGSAYLDAKMSEAVLNFSSLTIDQYVTKGKDGKHEITTENRTKIKKKLAELYYAVFREMDQNPTKLFNELFQPYTHGYYTTGLQGVLSKFINHPKMRELLEGTESWRFLSTLPNYTQTLYNNAQLFHDLPIYALNPKTHEQWVGFVAQYYPSEIAEIFDENPLMQLARSQIPRYIRQRIALNKNQLPENLYDQWYGTKEKRTVFRDQEELERILRQRAGALGIEVEDWEISRAVSYGRGLGMLTLTDLQTMGEADPNPSFRSIPDMVKMLKQRHKWRQGHGSYMISYYPEFFTMPIEISPEKRGFFSRLLRPRKWVPKKIKEYAEKKSRSLSEEMDYRLLDREGAWQELMNTFDLGDQFTRAGWRMAHLKPGGGDTESSTGILLAQKLRTRNLEWSENEHWNKDQWRTFYDVITEDMGAGAIWFYMEERVESELIALVERNAGKLSANLQLKEPDRNDPDYDKKLEKYRGGIKDLIDSYLGKEKAEVKRAHEKIIKVDGKMYTLPEAKEMIEFKVKGDIFQYQLRRSPADFLLNLQLLVPELMDDFKHKPDEHGNEERIVSKLWKRDWGIPKDRDKDYKDLDTHEQFIFDRWGKEGIAELKKIHDWINDLDARFDEKRPYPGGNIDFSALEGITDPRARARLHREAVLKYFYEESGTAFERVKLRNEGKENIPPEELFLQKEDVSDPVLQEMLFEKGGLVNHLQSFENKQFGKLEDVNNSDFFYIAGKAWTLKNGVDNPTTSDVDYFKVYQDIANVGQGMLRRLHGDIDSWEKVAGQIGNLDRILATVARTKDLSPLMKLHHDIQITFEDIVGKELGYKANYLLSSLVISFFWEHKLARGFPGILKTIPMRLFLGRDISLSKLHGNRQSWSWGDKEVRDYLQGLTFDTNGLAREKGERWSYEQIKRAFSADTDTHATNQIMSGMTLLILYLVYSAMKKALEEESGKRGR